ncbi:glycosyltransferase family 32 protein [Paraclostridium bifermentans]|uniref:glycosyltransferase family 32 protein n=2 Tax=Bacillota TaxID=1239 RepID=UPI001FF2FAEB|nr:glycosyltransferase [Paraclostridium bifermentans]UOW67498.1 glycosyl transferase [Paraclostridium bifermentans]
MNNNIPKTIHYCWFGGNEKSDFIKQCMESWRKYLPEYKIIEWNESSFDINSNNFVKAAYDAKKWAFVSDYVRAYAIYNMGGVYLDTDVEIKQPIDEFLKHRAFTGFESKYTPFTAVFGAEKEHPWVKDMINIYNNKEYLDSEGNFNATTNTLDVSKLMIEKYGATQNNKYQILKEDIHIYPNFYFCRPNKSEKVYAIHHFEGTWITGSKKSTRDLVKKILGRNLATKIMDIKSNIEFKIGLKKFK